MSVLVTVEARDFLFAFFSKNTWDKIFFFNFDPELKLQQQEKTSCVWNTERLCVIIIMHESVAGVGTVLL